jgi:hypothetical protein
MTPSQRRSTIPTALTALLLGLVLTACLPKATAFEPVDGPTRGKGGGDLDKLAADLVALHEQYQAFVDDEVAGGPTFSPSDPALLVADGRVAVDATAIGDPALLERDLIALGLRDAARVGPVVSGYLPIVALPDAAALTTLRHLTAAKAGLR